MGDLRAPLDDALQPSQEVLLSYTTWFLQFINPDRSSDYQDRSWDLLRALLIQHKADWEDGCSAKPVPTQDLWRYSLQERGELPSDATSDTARKRVNDHWGVLTSRFAEFEGRFAAAARKAGLSGLLWPEKHQSSGGKSSTYYLEWRKFGEVVTLPQLPPGYNERSYVLRYHEDQSSLRFSWLGRLCLRPLLFRPRDATTVRIEGLRRWIPALVMGLITAFIGVMVILALIAPTPAGLNWSLLIMAATIYWAYLHPLIRLYDRKIIMASPLFYPLKDRDCQVEILWDDPIQENERSRAYNLRLVRYASECPLCGAKIWLEDGKFEYRYRLIGRCTEEPGEHVFSFDRKLRAGYWLRDTQR